MSYVKTEWATGDVITAQKLNNMEDGIEAIDEYADVFTADVSESVENWLDDHPEATTTVEDNAITTPKLQDGAVTTPKLANGSVTDDKLASDGIKAEVSDLKTDLDDLADTQEFVFLDETVSGTRSQGVTVNMPAGTYHIECDGVTSSDTQYTTSRVIFGLEGGGSVSKDWSRNTPISVDYTFADKVTSIGFYGAHNYSDSGGVTFSYDNVRITQPTNLGKRLNAVESKEEAIATDLANVKGDLEYPSVIENTATTPSTAYAQTNILTNLTFKKNSVYLINVSTKSWVNTVYLTLKSGDTTLKTFNLSDGATSGAFLYYSYSDVNNGFLYCTTSATKFDVYASVQEYPSAIITDKNESKIKTIGDSASYKFDCPFIRRGLSSGGYVDSQTYRASCTEMQYADRDLNLTIASGYKIGIHTFDSSGNFTGDGGWIYGSHHIAKGTYFKVVIAKDPEDTSTPADIDEYVNAVRINTYLLDEVKPLKTVGENLANLGNPFKDGVYFSHIGVDQTNDIIIPCQSIADVSRTRRLGFKVLELNVRKTSDNKYVCLHGISGKFGYQFEDTNGNSVADVYVNSMTLAEIKSGIRFKSKYARYKTAPFSLQEMLYECKKQGIIPLVEYQNGYTDEIEILDSIMGKNNYILSIYNSNRGNVTDAMCTSWLTITDPTQLVNKCNASGGMYIAGLNVSDSAYSSFTDDDWISLASAVHEAGYLIGFNTGYAGEVKSQKLLSLGYDVSGSGWNINDFEQGNLCNLFCGTDFDGFTTNGTVSNGTLSLANGQTIAPTETLPSVFLGGGSLHIRFNGTISLVFGEHINATFTSDGTTEMWFSTYFEEASPTFLITSSGSTEIYDINYKASEM